MRLAPEVTNAIKSGPVPVMRDWRSAPSNQLTKAEKVMKFAETYLKVPDGIEVGQPLRLHPFQEAFLYSVFDNEVHTDTAVLSIARRNGKTFLIAVIVLAYLVGPLAIKNASIASAANSRAQAALVFNMMVKMLMMSSELSKRTHIVPSAKKITGTAMNTEYLALSAEAKTGHGQSFLVLVLDESGQIRGPTNEYVSMLRSSQGSHTHPLFVTISTQAATDADFLSVLIDDAVKSRSESTVCHVYSADDRCDLMDETQWKKANPGLGTFRSVNDLRTQLEQASRLPPMENGVRNLLLNCRISQDTLWLAPSVWKACGEPFTLEWFRGRSVSMGLDLSARHDLTAAVIAAKDEVTGFVHIYPFVFCPSEGVVSRAQRDRAPYDYWVDNGFMHTCGRGVMNYEELATKVRDMLYDAEITVSNIEFDRWRINEFKGACERVGFATEATWHEVGQGFRDFSPRCEAFQSEMLAKTLRHGNHPLFNMAAASAIAVSDPAGSIKLDKAKSSQRIDPIVAAVMAVFPITDGSVGQFDVLAMIG